MGSSILEHFRSYSWLKRTLLVIAVCTFLSSSFLYLTPPGTFIREYLAKTVITTQHRDWAWIFVGAQRRDQMVLEMQNLTEVNSVEKQDLHAVQFNTNRPIESLVKVEDISGQFWKGKKMYVYDPRTIRVVVPAKQGEGERITSMVQRTGAVAGVNGGGFNDPDGLGNGFAPIGAIMSGGEILYTDQEGSIPQHIVGFTKEGTLIIGKYTIDDLLKLGVTDAVSFYPRVIANGKPLITSGDGGWGRAPRTAVGQKADGTVIFIVIDGRQTHSVGATLKEVQDIFLADGVINAGFLDGGASSEMVYNDELITKPSSRYGERRLPSAFLVFDHPEDVVVKNVWAGLTTIDPGGAYDHPDFLKEQAEKKANPPKATPKPSTTPTPSNKPESSNETGKNGGGTTQRPSESDNGSVKPSPTAKPQTTPSPTPTPTPPASGTPTPTPGNGGGTTGTGGSTTGASSTPKPSATPTPNPSTTQGQSQQGNGNEANPSQPAASSPPKTS
ncbi:phosphodiester glycosidase family protein [Paenibacillus aceris]|uniref:Exopolysaccharide biosynthesis protein n=1 Tax=Paenibacillus aceris TaxID=869555 RepID=A0ABS4I5Q8_9BACL|nr:phosphodiester glycosidase family protein [Paenibacillus aceris]MBP1966065.1 exopolysaccharide biosynthesis protein [Paenibacillus aceris]NHW39708.1 phosphodiester glycosidase family protein [Paenibacillus aceris]